MITQRLKTIFLISLLIIYIHGFEEIIGGFQHVDTFMMFGANLFSISTEIFYWSSHLIWWLAIPLLYLIFKNKPKILLLLGLYGLVFVVELHHVVKAVQLGSYYPGAITALFYPIIGFFFWREWLLNFKNKSVAERQVETG
ncbi:MAG TPA: HXXEE domain-containing protein [Candidatus Paceibacterota bacterium]